MEDNEDDIYLAPELYDSNSGAAQAVITFFNYLTSSRSPMPNFDYVLVTDDTSYVALDKVLSRLHKTIGDTSLTGMSKSEIYLHNKSPRRL